MKALVFRGAVLMALTAMLVAACSSGGGGGGGGGGQQATALTVTEKVSVVEPKITSAITGARPLLMAVSVPADSDYAVDKTNVYVQERSTDAFRQINEILCMVAQTKYDVMLNAGPYLALVDQSKCASGKSDASEAGQEAQNQSSGSGAPEYMKWIVDVTRASDNDPQIMKVWIHEQARPNDNDFDKVIVVRMEITEGVSESNPLGIFTINYKGLRADDPSQVFFSGFLKSERDAATGKVLIKSADDDQHEGSQRQATLDKGTDGTGKGTSHQTVNNTWANFDQTINIAYNQDNFLRTESGQQDVCLDRNDFDISAWSYGLYNASSGARINRNSGFSINTKADGTGSYGWVGYQGVWLDQNTSLTNNQTVYKYDYSTKSSTAYTVFTAGGKLKKHTKKNLTLADVKGIPMDYWEQTQSGGTQYRVVWDGTNFNKVAQMPSNCSNNCTWQTIVTSPTPTINVGQLPWSDLNFWAQSLGGQVRVTLPGCSWQDPDGAGGNPGYTACGAPTNATAVIFYKEDIVYPTDTIPATLRCYDNNCLQAGANGIDPNNPFFQAWDPQTGTNTPKDYAFATTTMLLMDGANAVVSSATDTVNQWGYMSGAMVDTGTANLNALLDCNWDNDNNPATQPQICGWKAWSVLDVFYTWETGNNTWNRFTALKDGTGAFLKFDPPLQIKYVHADASSPFNGATFMLEYNGFGNLWGIPGKCVDMDTGLEGDCSGGSKMRWVPAFSIKPGSSAADDTGTAYLVKPLEMEQRMKQAPGGCANLSATTYALPSMTEWQDPAIGTEPTITDPPAVIGGVVQ